MAIRLAGRQGDLDALINVWIKTIEQDPTTDFRYLANRKDIEAGPFAKEARSKCAKYLLRNLVAVYEVDGKIVAMACWSFVHPTMPAGSFAMCKSMCNSSVHCFLFCPTPAPFVVSARVP